MKDENQVLDAKVGKRHYPRANSGTTLEFVLEKDPNLFLRRNRIVIKGSIKVNEDFVVENGWVAKLFSQISVQLDSQPVSLSRQK